MARTIKVDVGGRQMDAVEVDFTIRREDWNEYELADGGRVRVRASVHRLLRVLEEDGRPARAPNGDPLIVVQSTNAVVASD
jgi:hypothetical protein